MSVLSHYWEWSTLDLNVLRQNIPQNNKIREYADGKLILFIDEKNSDENTLEEDKMEWLNNPNVVANMHSGLWSSCLSVSGILNQSSNTKTMYPQQGDPKIANKFQ